MAVFWGRGRRFANKKQLYASSSDGSYFTLRKRNLNEEEANYVYESMWLPAPSNGSSETEQDMAVVFCWEEIFQR